MNQFYKCLLGSLLAIGSSLSVGAQTNLSDVVSAPKFGGIIIGKYAYQDNDGSTNNGDGFNARIIRLYLDGSILKDFKYRLQMEVNGDNTVGKGAHVKDFYVEWSKYKEFSVRVGQFKRAFSFENPYNPLNVGVGDYSQLVKKLAGMGDRCGEASTGGRDQGIQVQGDLLPAANDEFRYLHYQLAVYNGNGINHGDNNKQKDLIGTIQVQPVKDLYLGVFGWKGTYGKQGFEVDRNRYSLGLKYEGNWSVRAEYAHSHGAKYDGVHVGGTGTTKADAYYAIVGVPVSKLVKVFAKYDVYRDGCESDNANTIYSLATNFRLHKNLIFQLQYNRVVGSKAVTTAPQEKYNQLWAQAYIRW